MSARYSAMPRDGCSEAQLRSLPLIARAASGLAASAERASAATGTEPPLAGDSAFLEFQDRLARFEDRRGVLRQELAAMRQERSPD